MSANSLNISNNSNNKPQKIESNLSNKSNPNSYPAKANIEQEKYFAEKNKSSGSNKEIKLLGNEEREINLPKVKVINSNSKNSSAKNNEAKDNLNAIKCGDKPIAIISTNQNYNANIIQTSIGENQRNNNIASGKLACKQNCENDKEIIEKHTMLIKLYNIQKEVEVEAEAEENEIDNDEIKLKHDDVMQCTRDFNVVIVRNFIFNKKNFNNKGQ